MREPLNERDERRSQLAHRDSFPEPKAKHFVDEETGAVTIYDGDGVEQWIECCERYALERREIR